MKKPNLIFIPVILLLILTACPWEEENIKPICEFMTPSFGDQFKIGDLILISVNASDEDGIITEVQIYIDGTLIESLKSSPFSFEWNSVNSAEGSHIIEAIAIDNSGGKADNQIEILLEKGIQTFTDQRDGKVYKYVKIGNQTWMAENLAYLPNVNIPTDASYTEPSYYVYDYSGIDVNEAKANDNYKTHGVLYNWPASLNACPSGWHFPSYQEWEQLFDFISQDNGGYAKTDDFDGYTWENVAKHLKSLSANGTDDYNFSILMSGELNCQVDPNNNKFKYLNDYAFLYNTKSSDTYNTVHFQFDSDFNNIYSRGNTKWDGYSVRCVKD